MRAGRLRHRVRIERLTTTVDPFGQPIQTWATLADVWAEVQALSGREYWAAQQVQAEATYRVRMRYRADVLPTDRIVHDGLMLNIQHVADPTGRRRELEAICTA